MTISDVALNTSGGSVSRVPALGGGNLYVANLTCELDDAVASHSLAPIYTALGLPTTGPQVIGIVAGGGLALEDGGVGVTPCVDIANNALTFRSGNTGVAEVIAADAGAGLSLTVICIY